MTADKSKESPKGSDESLERQKRGRLEGTDKADVTAKSDAGSKEQAEASVILSQAANKNPLEPEVKIQPLVAMQGVMDTSGDTTPGTVGKAADADQPVTDTKPIKTPDDMYERMFDSNRDNDDKTSWQSEGKNQFKLGTQFWEELPAEKQVKLAQNSQDAKAVQAEPKALSVPVGRDSQTPSGNQGGKDTINVSDMNNAHVPIDTKNQVVLHINASESVYKTPPEQETRKRETQKPETQKQVAQKPDTGARSIAKEEIVPQETLKIAFDNAKPLGLKNDAPKVSDVHIPVAKTNDAVALVAETNLNNNVTQSSGTTLDSDGKTIGHWYKSGNKFVATLTMDGTDTAESKTAVTDKTKPTQKSSPITASFSSNIATRNPSAGIKESFAPPETVLNIAAEPSAVEPLKQPRNIVASNLPSSDVVVPQAESKTVPNVSQQPVDVVTRANTDTNYTMPKVEPLAEKIAVPKELVAHAPTSSPHAEVARAAENISKSVAPVQEHADSNHPLGTALVQKASIVQRDVQDVVSSQGAKQEKAIVSLENSVKNYNKLVESNPATAAIADKLRIASADVDSLKAVFQSDRLESTKDNAEQSKLATKVDGLFALRDQAHANFQKTIDLIEQSKDQNLIGRLFQSAMILSLASNKDLSSPAFADISAAALVRAITDSTSVISFTHPADKSIDFAPDSQTLAVSQESRSGAAPISPSQTNAQANTPDGQAVRLDNAVNPVFSAIAFNAGTNESYEELARLVEERVENQRLYQELPDWMKEKGFRISLSPGTPSSGESSFKATIAFAPRIRGAAIGDARIVAPTFKTLPSLGDRHTLTGQLQGISRVLGGFDAVSLAQYNHLMQLLQTTEDKALAKVDRSASGQSVQQDKLLMRYPFLAQANQSRSSALLARPDSGVDFGPAFSQGSPSATATAASPILASAAGQQEPPAGQVSTPANQDEET